MAAGCISRGVLFTLYFGYRRLAFDSFDSVGSAAQGLKSKYISIYFLLILAVSVSIGAQIVGSLLVFILLTLPPNVAKYLGKTLPQMIVISVVTALIGVGVAFTLAF